MTDTTQQEVRLEAKEGVYREDAQYGFFTVWDDVIADEKHLLDSHTYMEMLDALSGALSEALRDRQHLRAERQAALNDEEAMRDHLLEMYVNEHAAEVDHDIYEHGYEFADEVLKLLKVSRDR